MLPGSWMCNAKCVTAPEAITPAASCARISYAPRVPTSARAVTIRRTSRPRLDIPAKVDGSAVFGLDVRISGMVYAAVKASPAPWGTLKSYNFDAIKSRPGVIAAVELKAVPGKRGQPDMQNAIAVVASKNVAPKRSTSGV